MSEQLIAELGTEIKTQLEALGSQISDEALDKRVRAIVETLEPAVIEKVRKMRFGADADAAVSGSKFARFGLGVADIEWLYAIRSGLTGQKRVSGGGVYGPPSEQLQNVFGSFRHLQVMSDADLLKQDENALIEQFARTPASMFFGRDADLARKGHWMETDAYKRAHAAIQDIVSKRATGAHDTAEAGYGQQLVGAQYVRELWEAARRIGRVYPLFNTFQMTDPTTYLPVEADLPELLFVSENTGPTDSEYDTTKTGSRRVQVDAKKFVIHQIWSGEMEEDSIIPFVPFLRAQSEKSLAHYLDSLVLNGDTTNAGTGNINLDDADPADSKHYLAFDGVRHAGIVDNTANKSDQAGPITLSALQTAKGRMLDSTYLLDWGHPTDPSDLVYACDPETADKISMLDEVTTVDKYGQQATVLTGEQGKVLGHPLVSTIAISKTEADGKVSTTGSNNTKGQVVSFNRRGFVLGVRRTVKIEPERLPARDQTRLVHSLRLGFGRYSPTGSASGIEAADVIYNITL